MGTTADSDLTTDANGNAGNDGATGVASARVGGLGIAGATVKSTATTTMVATTATGISITTDTDRQANKKDKT